MDLSDAQFIYPEDAAKAALESRRVRVTPADILRRAHEVVDLFRLATGQVPTGRLTQYPRLIDGFIREYGQTPVSKVPERSIWCYHFWQHELGQLRFILNILGPLPEFANHLRAIAGGNVFPRDDSNRQARNLAFELFVAARLIAAGFAVDPGEPDLIVQDGDFRFGVAAKRLKSQLKLAMRVSEGSKQILKSGLPGIIALDVSTCFHADERLPRISEGGSLEILGAEYLTTTLHELRRLSARFDSSQVFAFLLFLNTPILEEYGAGVRFHMRYMTRWIVVDEFGEAFVNWSESMSQRIARSYADVRF